jgi:hypothetical protein
LNVGRKLGAGHSGVDNGWISGGYDWVTGQEIDKFAYSSNTTATDWGDLPVNRLRVAGCQY